MDFFISYNRADRTWAEWIAWELERAGYSTLLQAWDFRPGHNFALKMQEASARTERTIAVLSPDYLASEFTAAEWAEAFAADPSGENGLLLPIRVRECEPTGMLGQIVYVDLVGLDESEAKNVLLGGVQRGRAKPGSKPRFPAQSSPTARPQPIFPGLPGPSLVKKIQAMWAPIPGMIKAITTLLTTVLGLIAVMIPAGIPPFDPDPPATNSPIEFPVEFPETTPTRPTTTFTTSGISRGGLAAPRIEHNVALGNGCEQRGWPCEKFEENDYGTVGDLVNVEVHMQGYAGRSGEVRWSIHDAKTGAALERFREQPGWPEGVVRPDRDDDYIRAEVWVPYPMMEGSFFLRLLLFNDQDTELDCLEIKPFEGISSDLSEQGRSRGNPEVTKCE
jgi:TIR domain